MKIQAVLFDRRIYDSTQARAVLKKMKLKPIKKVHKTEHYLRYRIVAPSRFKKFRTRKAKGGYLVFIMGVEK